MILILTRKAMTCDKGAWLQAIHSSTAIRDILIPHARTPFTAAAPIVLLACVHIYAGGFWSGRLAARLLTTLKPILTGFVAPVDDPYPYRTGCRALGTVRYCILVLLLVLAVAFEKVPACIAVWVELAVYCDKWGALLICNIRPNHPIGQRFSTGRSRPT